MARWFQHIDGDTIYRAPLWLKASIAVPWVAFAIAMWGGNTTRQPSTTNNDVAIMAQVFVKPRLKSPSTADFPPSDHFHVKKIGQTETTKTWEVKGYVDAQNSFGATVRQYFTCHIEKHNGRWGLLDLEFR